MHVGTMMHATIPALAVIAIDKANITNHGELESPSTLRYVVRVNAEHTMQMSTYTAQHTVNGNPW